VIQDLDKEKQHKKNLELKKLEDEIRQLENHPIIINQDEVKYSLSNIDRLKTLKFLTHMHTNIKNGLVKHLKNDETQEAFQEFID
jgi:hypothetical protein